MEINYDDIVVSFLMPCRGERPSFIECIKSIDKTCSNPVRAEILLKIDSDSDWRFYNDVLKNQRVPYKILSYDRLGGWGDAYLFHKDLCAISKGRTLWQICDDMTIHSGDWLKEIEDCFNFWQDQVFVCFPAYMKYQRSLEQNRYTLKRAGVVSHNFYTAMGKCLCHKGYVCDRLIYNVAYEVKRAIVKPDIVLLNIGDRYPNHLRQGGLHRGDHVPPLKTDSKYTVLDNNDYTVITIEKICADITKYIESAKQS